MSRDVLRRQLAANRELDKRVKERDAKLIRPRRRQMRWWDRDLLAAPDPQTEGKD
jgi:hypothetical protein